MAARRSDGDGNDARLIIVDDEPRLAHMLMRLLEKDYDVVVFSSGEEALAVILGLESTHVVLCDIQMPGLTGPEVARRALEARPDLPCPFVFMTGGDADVVQLAGGSFPVLRKPLDMTELRALLQRVREGHGGGAPAYNRLTAEHVRDIPDGRERTPAAASEHEGADREDGSADPRSGTGAHSPW